MPFYELAAQVSAGAWRQLSAGDGAKGPARLRLDQVPIRPLRELDKGPRLLVRRGLADGELASYVCYGQPGQP